MFVNFFTVVIVFLQNENNKEILGTIIRTHIRRRKRANSIRTDAVYILNSYYYYFWVVYAIIKKSPNFTAQTFFNYKLLTKQI